MHSIRLSQTVCGCLGLVIILGGTSVGTFAAEPIRSSAIVNLTFDEPGGQALDSAKAGKTKDNGQLVNGPQRVASPFWGQQGKQALLLNAARRQFVQMADSPDLDRPQALSLSLFAINLHDRADAAAHGLFGKHIVRGRKRTANYGINFVPKSDLFQFFVHDRRQYHAVAYSLNNTLGFRKRVFLIVTMEVGDAPAPDADTQKDDIRVRLFVNGAQVKPGGVSRGAVVGNDAWLTNITLPALLNNQPLTLGSIDPQTQPASVVIDEFSLFNRALTPDEAAKLFVEVAGPHAVELAKQDQNWKPAQPLPQITTIFPHSLEIGQTTRLTVTGRNLSGSTGIAVPIDAGAGQRVVKGSTSSRLIVDVTVPTDAVTGLYPLRVQTAAGLSNPLPIAVDRLPVRSIGGSSAARPATLPGAFSGALSGSAQARVYFKAKKGQSIVAEVEARRLGARLDPVVEIKTAIGTPLMIAWGKTYLRGDARAETIIPADGIYFAEFHDLSYKAPGGSPFRLKVGNLRIADACFPPAVAVGSRIGVELIGTGLPIGTAVADATQAVAPRQSQLLRLSPVFGISGPAPVFQISDGIEVVEAAQPGEQLQRVRAQFGPGRATTVAINGRISRPEERDRYLVEVTPGQRLRLTVEARSINSPLDGQLEILSDPQEKLLAVSNDRPGTRDPGLTYAVPAKVHRIRLAVRDLYDHGGPHFIYRLRIAPVGRSDFRLTSTAADFRLPVNGTAIVQLQLRRRGYNGPVRLRAVDSSVMAISPDRIPAGKGDRKVFVTLTGIGPKRVGDLRRLQIVAESEGLTPPIRRLATVAAASGTATVPGFADLIRVAITPAVQLDVKVGTLPPALFKGVTAEIPVTVTRADKNSSSPIRLTLLSTESPRRVAPRNPKNRTMKPLVRALPAQSIPAGTSAGVLRVAVPSDVAEREIEFVIRADMVPHPYAPQSQTAVYSRPFRLPVRTAAQIALKPQSLKLTAGGTGHVRGTIKRTPGFSGSVVLALAGLPKGVTARPVVIPGNQQTFDIPVTIPKTLKPAAWPKVVMRMTVSGGKLILPARPVPLHVLAAPKKPQPAAKPVKKKA